MKKGRHRRYEEARALKHTSDELDVFFDDHEEPCVECKALPGQDHKSWCVNAEEEPVLEDPQDLFPS